MNQPLSQRILDHIKGSQYRPQRPRRLAKELELSGDEEYPAFREALKELMHQGRVVLGAGGALVLPSGHVRRDTIQGTYRHNRKGFGFVVPTDPDSHEDLYIAEGDNAGAITGDVVIAKITSRGHRGGRQLLTGRILEIVERKHKRFAGTLVKQVGRWVVMPDGNTLTDPIEVADASSRHVRPGTKVVVELTTYPEPGRFAQGVITEVLGREGEKDVDLKSVIIQHNLPQAFPDEVLGQARHQIDHIDWEAEKAGRVDLTGETIVTIDPNDAKDYDDAISLTRLEDGQWELGVHIADVARFVPAGSPLDREAQLRGNSAYFPGFVIPMLPEILSNGICSLQEGVPRLCKSVWITLDAQAHVVKTRFANTVIRSAKRLRYREAQALIDGAKRIPHPEGEKSRHDYAPEVLELLDDMNTLAQRIQKRRLRDGQLVLELPVVELVLDQDGKVVDAAPEDTSFTHTLIEMFMVEANEAVARLLDGLRVPFLRRVHPGPGEQENVRLREFIAVSGYKLPKQLDRKAIQSLLDTVRGKPQSYPINLAILKSLTRAEYSPEEVGHFALASEYYCHFTSPIRRYADLTVHRLLQTYLDQQQEHRGSRGHRKPKFDFSNHADYSGLVELGRHISFTERRAEDAERELRQVKVLTLLQGKLGEVYDGVITGITNFGVFIQLQRWLVEGLIRFEHLADDWWEVNERTGEVRGQRTGSVLRMGDAVKVKVAKVDLPRRELDLGMVQWPGARGGPKAAVRQKHERHQKHGRHAKTHGGKRGSRRRFGRR